ncbi:unnamed protein product [Rhizoctonia solani]|uniref:Uncharacterized protein n=1 Tax=Rhizoctonia solani TaxID=456999 RepID=A0A8H3CKV1_9AGAM|nr:unnamed protein product [Rhizoctonia solani]
MTPCQLTEKTLCENTTPDGLTTQALEWLIQHSRREVVDEAIKAISRADLDVNGWALLAQGSLISVVAQKFTSICNGMLGRGHETKRQENQSNASLYGRALVNIVQHAGLKRASFNGTTGYNTSEEIDSQVITLDEEQVQAVESGLRRLALTGDCTISAYAIAGLSSWYTSTSRSNQTRDKWKTTLNKLIDLLSQVVDADNHRRPQALYPDDDVLVELVQTLAVEISHWRWELSKQEMIKLLKSLISLYYTSLLEGPTRTGMSAALAVLALLFNDYQEISLQEVNDSQPAEIFLKDAMEVYKQRTHDYTTRYGDFHVHTSKPERAKRRPWRAQSTAILCATNQEYLDRYSNELLLFGLAGLLDSFSELQLEAITDSEVYSVATLVATQLVRIPITFQSQTATLPWVLPSTFDLKLYLVDVITRVINPSPGPGVDSREIFVLRAN